MLASVTSFKSGRRVGVKSCKDERGIWIVRGELHRAVHCLQVLNSLLDFVTSFESERQVEVESERKAEKYERRNECTRP
jgi:Zn-finger nucleic acid-binding protein